MTIPPKPFVRRFWHGPFNVALHRGVYVAVNSKNKIKVINNYLDSSLFFLLALSPILLAAAHHSSIS